MHHINSHARETAMAASFESFKDLDITRDDVERIGEALKDEKFRKLLNEYIEELHDPEQQKVYQEEITQLEKERGYDVTFINPTAGYVIKTSVNGTKKAFVNICANDNIQKPQSKSVTQNGSKGLQWSLPHSLTPPREDVDRKGQRCQVFDVVFHPDTLYLAKNNKAFSKMVNNTACEAIESNFNVQLDGKNLKFPKMQYKGMAHAAVIRKESKDKPELSAEEAEVMEKVYKTMPKVEKQTPKNIKVKKVENDTEYTTPTYLIKHRSHVELEEFTEHKTAKYNSAIPKELIIEVNLPLLKSAGDIVLDVTEKTVQLISEKPSKYKLYLTLPYAVNENAGNAKFDKDTKRLIITLPVKRADIFSVDINRDDSGVESDHGSPLLASPTEDFQNRNVSDFRTTANTFLEPDTHYSLPDSNCHIYENVLAFTLNVKNVDETTLCKMLEENIIHIKFATVSSGFYTVNYAFCIKLQDHIIKTEDLSIEIWDNNVVMQIPFEPCDKIVTSYLVGLDRTSLETKYIEDPSIINKILENEVRVLKNNSNELGKKEIDNTEQGESSKDITSKLESPKKLRSFCSESDERTTTSKAIDIIGAISESSGDELSYSYSPSKCRGILKRFSTSRSSVSRSISESSIDDAVWVSSFENCNSLDSVIPEDGEVSTSLKKTVRFNDVVLKQRYR